MAMFAFADVFASVLPKGFAATLNDPALRKPESGSLTTTF
jgi:hypothetical protein